ncbi:hypothetical protein [Rhizobium rhizogenes]|uniref:hypothetical protein n=1 Tax=Rhizobium rhizogenes TaxID=359 RepID=UPI001574DD8C|nr:hypothetical protein [Rhizobium rhizogenes]NTI30509.1 hypothetical protein [Rhizobium rhizogenes]
MIESSDVNDSLLSKGDVLELICTLFPWIADFRQRSLQDYAHAAFDAQPYEGHCGARDHAMLLLQQCIRRAALATGMSEDRAYAMATGMAKAPVLQTGPHLHLLIEPDAYYTHLFSVTGLKAHHRSTYISYAVSTVKFVERGRKGPGWLKLDGDSVNVFGLSRSQMIPYSILARNGIYRFALKNVDRSGAAGDTAARLQSMLPQKNFLSAALAIKCANRCLWNQFFDPVIDFLQIDDEDVADLVAEHLKDGSSWLARRLFNDGDFAQNLIRHTEALSEGPWCGWFKNSTDLFWGNESGRLIPLRLVSSQLEARGAENFVLRFSAADLIDALHARKIIPNLFLMFIVTAILPGVRVLGGSRHTVYYPLMRYVLCRALEANGSDSDLLSTIAADTKPGMWGHRVLLADTEPFSELESLRRGDISVVLERYRALSLEEACGALESFATDPMWVHLKDGMMNRGISPKSPEWSFSQ